MKTRHMILLLLTCVLLVLMGCGRQQAEDMIENTIGGLMEAQNEAIEQEAQNRRTYSDDDSIEVMSSKWPKEIPREYVEFDYGTHLQTVLHLEDGNWTILYTATMVEIENYEKDLANAGWVNDDSYNNVSSVLSYDLGKRNTSVVIGDAENNRHNVTIYLDNGDDLKGDQDMLEEELVVESDGLSHTVGGKIPDGYPHDFCPIYEPSEVLMAIESEDDEFIGYIVGFTTVDEMEKVKDFYLALNPQSSSDMGMGVVYVFEAENGIDYASVTIMKNQDETDKEFETSVNISVSLSK